METLSGVFVAEFVFLVSDWISVIAQAPSVGNQSSLFLTFHFTALKNCILNNLHAKSICCLENGHLHVCLAFRREEISVVCFIRSKIRVLAIQSGPVTQKPGEKCLLGLHLRLTEIEFALFMTPAPDDL